MNQPEQVISRDQVEHHLRTQATASTAALSTRTLWCRDSHGEVLVLLPEHDLADLGRLRQHAGRPDLQPCPDQPTPTGLQALAIAGDTTLVVDERLLAAEVVFLATGEVGQWARVPGPEFQQLARSAMAAPVTVMESQLAPVPDDRSNERPRIEASLNHFTQLRVRQRLDETFRIPPLPAAAQRILQLRSDPDCDLSDLVGVVETDPSLAAQIVGWANSAYYGAPSTVTSVNDAIMRVLGFDMVFNLAVGLAMSQGIEVPSSKNKGLPRYWQQAVFTAAAVEGLARLIPSALQPSVGLSYLAGLLHNYGYVVLAHVFPPHFITISDLQAANPHLPTPVIDNYVLGITREELAAQLLENWALPVAVCNAIRYQHNPMNADPTDNEGHAATGANQSFCAYTDLLYIATRSLAERGMGVAPDRDGLVPVLMDRLGMDPDRAQGVLDTVLDSAEDLDGIISMLEH